MKISGKTLGMMMLCGALAWGVSCYYQMERSADDPQNANWLDWKTETSMEVARQLLAAVACNGKIYAIGGYGGPTGSAILKTMEEYNPNTGFWKQDTDNGGTLAPMPTVRRALGAVCVNSKIYVIGGINGGYLSTVEEYNPATNSWAPKTPIPALIARANFSIAVVNDKIFIIGGRDESGAVLTVEEYDPATGNTSTKLNMPLPSWDISTAVHGDKIYVIGGYDGTDRKRSINAYVPGSNTWEKDEIIVGVSGIKLMPTARTMLVAAAIEEKIFAIGGDSVANDHLSLVEVYDPKNNSWETGMSMPTGRSGAAVAILNGKAYVIGGYDGSGNCKTVERFGLYY